jgi:hypothetical protein
MPTVTAHHDVKDKDHWLASPRREEVFGLWVGKIAVACGWPPEVRRFRVPMQLPEIS